MKLKQIYTFNLVKRFCIYVLLLTFEIGLFILMMKEIKFKENLNLDYLFAQFSQIKYFSLYYIPLFLFVLNNLNILDNYLVFTKYTNIKDWWKEKIKKLMAETLIYISIFASPIIIAVMVNGKKLILSNLKASIFIIIYFLIVFMLFCVVGVIYLITSFTFKKQYIGFAISFLVGSLDFLLSLFKYYNFAMTTSGMLADFILSFRFPLKKFLFLQFIYVGYFIMFFILLNFISCTILEKSDLYRGDIKLER